MEDSMIVREFYATRRDGVDLYHTYSDAGHVIRQEQTGEEYEDAIEDYTELRG